MPTPASQLPPDATTLARRIATLEREVRELRAARRLEAATVGAGGVRVTAGGRLAMDTPPGVRVVDVGAIRDERFNHSDGTPQQAIWMRREDGTDVFTCFGGIGDATQAWAFWDRQDNPVIADDTVSGSGLARPYLPVPMAPAYQGAGITGPARHPQPRRSCGSGASTSSSRGSSWSSGPPWTPRARPAS